MKKFITKIQKNMTKMFLKARMKFNYHFSFIAHLYFCNNFFFRF